MRHSIVTGEPTIQIRLFLLMAFNAKSHPEGHTFDPVHRLNLPVASLAQDVFLDMPFMIENDVFRQVIGLSPRRWRFRVKISVLLFDLGMTSDDILVAIEALLNRRHPGKFGSSHVGMTEFARDLLHPRVNTVTERYGLLGPDVQGRTSIEVIKKEKNEQATAAG
jgi:hypothetical protein